MQQFLKELPLEEGFEVVGKPKHSRLVAGKPVSTCGGVMLFCAMRHGPIACYSCGCLADRWVADTNQTGFNKLVLNLYGTKTQHANGAKLRYPRLVLMTRDHIIPRSMGGVDQLENLRVACADCNVRRGSNQNAEEKAFMNANPQLIDEHRRLKGERSAVRQAQKTKQMRDHVAKFADPKISP